MSEIDSQIKRLRENDFAGMETMRTFALGIIDSLRGYAPCTLEPAIDEIELAAAIGTCRFMDPPDGGDVSLIEQVRRMRAALDEAEAPRTAAIAAEPGVMAVCRHCHDEVSTILCCEACGGEIEPHLIAPASSPEIPDNSAASYSKIPNNSNCSKSSYGSPQPNAVKEQIVTLVLEAMGDVSDRDIYGTSYAQKFDRKRAEKAADDIAALSRPAHGGCEEATIERCAQLCDDAADRLLAAAIRSLKSGPAYPRNQGEGGGPRS